MRWSAGKIFARIALGLVLLLLVLVIALWLKPPDILRVGANYAAKIVCSNVFLAGRDPDEVLRTDVQAPGIALLGLMRVSVDRNQRVVRAGLAISVVPAEVARRFADAFGLRLMPLTDDWARRRFAIIR